MSFKDFTKHSFGLMCHRIDKEFIIYIFTPDFISSFINIILIKNGRGNRPADAVAAGSDIIGTSGAKSCPDLIGER